MDWTLPIIVALVLCVIIIIVAMDGGLIAFKWHRPSDDPQPSVRTYDADRNRVDADVFRTGGEQTPAIREAMTFLDSDLKR